MRKVLEGRGFTYGTSYTTRPPREGEIDGQDYYFISEKDFKRFADNNYWYEYVEFNGWYYGTSQRQFTTSCNLFIMTPKGIGHIDPVDRKECTIIYLNVPKAGLEPAQGCPHQPLKLACLPIPPLRHLKQKL